MKSIWITSVLTLALLASCTGGKQSGADSISELDLSLAELVRAAAPQSHGSQMFTVGKSDGMTKEYGYPFYQDLYDARIVLMDQEREGFMERLAAGVRDAIEEDGLRITGRSEGLDYRGFLYHGNGKRGTLDMFTILDAEQGTRIIIVVTEQPYQE